MTGGPGPGWNSSDRDDGPAERRAVGIPERQLLIDPAEANRSGPLSLDIFPCSFGGHEYGASLSRAISVKLCVAAIEAVPSLTR